MDRAAALAARWLPIFAAMTALGGCTQCGEEPLANDALASDQEARLVHVSGYEPGILAAAPHAPVLLPYLRHHSNVVFERGETRAVVLDVRPDELRGRPLRADPAGGRFAVHLEAGWTLFFVPEGGWTAMRDPQPLSSEPDWSSVPEWRDRVVAIFVATESPDAVVELAERDGAETLARLVRDGLEAPGGERQAGAMEWAHRGADRWMAAHERLTRLDEAAAAEATELLAGAYATADAPEVVLRRARWLLPPERLSIPASVGRARAEKRELDEVERAAALLAMPALDRARLACELLAAPDLPAALTAAAIDAVEPGCDALGAWVERHGCETERACEAGEPPPSALTVSRDLRDQLVVFPSADHALSTRCASGRALRPELTQRRRRLRYRLDVRANIGWDRVRRAACETTDDEMVVDGVTFDVDDEAERIQQRP